MLVQDVKYAVRTLLRKPGFAAVTLLTLGIGIGANAAIFGAVRAVLLRPLPLPNRVQTFSVSMSQPKYPTSAGRMEFVNQLIGRAAALPQVESAAAVYGLPLTDFSHTISLARLDGRALTRDPNHPRPSVQIRIVTPDYFKAMGIPLRSGRAIDSSDRHGGAPSVVINETAAAGIWPGQNPLGHEFSLGTPLGLDGPSAGGTVVGVVGDVRDFGPVPRMLPTVYLSYNQFPMAYLTLVLKTRGEPSTAIDPARAMLRDLDPDLPMFEIRSLTQLAGNVVAQPRLYVLVLALFAGAAILLAAIGIYGVLAHIVGQRTREIGIRLALGAPRGQVVRSVVMQATLLACAGLVAGLVIAAATGRFIGGLLFGVKPVDPITYGSVAAGLTIVAMAASWIPARRASRIDPVTALRHE